MTELYSVYGLAIVSDIALPELSVSPASGADIAITLGPVDGGEVATQSLMRFGVEGVARYEIGEGRRVRVDVEAGADWAAVRLFLLGSAMAAVLHQRGMMALHANAVVVNGAAIAFMGRSGSGKSTLAAWFAGNGFEVLSDDVCVLRTNDGGDIEAVPGVPRIRLCEDSAKAHRLDLSNLPEVAFPDGWRKFVVPLPHADRAYPLRAVFVIDRTRADLDRLSQSEAFAALSQNTYRGELVGPISGMDLHFAEMLDLSRKVPVYGVGRPKQIDDWTANSDLLAQIRQLSTMGPVAHAFP